MGEIETGRGRGLSRRDSTGRVSSGFRGLLGKGKPRNGRRQSPRQEPRQERGFVSLTVKLTSKR